MKTLFPGILLSGMIAIAADKMSELPELRNHLPMGPIMIAILLGMLLRNLLPIHGRFDAGIHFSVRRLLRIGVAGLGFGLGVNDLIHVGTRGFVLDCLLITGTYLFALGVGKALGLGQKLPILLATGTAICGASAVAAVNSVLKAKDGEVAFSVASVTLFGTLSMISFPVIAHTVGMPIPVYGAWAGSSIHEVAQVIGATMNVSPQALKFATILKLTRVSFLLPILVLLEVKLLHLFRREEERPVESSTRKHVPWFIVGFVGIVILNSMNFLNPDAVRLFQRLDTWCLAISMGALGLMTPLEKLKAFGPRGLQAGLWLWLFVSVWGLLLSFVLFGQPIEHVTGSQGAPS